MAPGGPARAEAASALTASVARAARQALVDFYFNSWRLAPANLAWGALLLAVILAGGIWLPALALVALLAVPVVGLHRMAALIARGEAVAFSDFPRGMRQFLRPALATGAAATVLLAIFTTNVLVGLEIGGVIGWTMSALALYGDIGLAMGLVIWWPILVDPQREHLSVGQRLRLAGLVALSRPGRLFGLTVLIGAVLVVSTILLAAIVLFGVAYTSLLASRYVLPVADRLEERMAARRAN